MAKVIIHEHEKQRILNFIKRNQGKEMSIKQYAALAGFNPNRTRFIFDELVEENRIQKIVTKKFNEKYIRYCYRLN